VERSEESIHVMTSVKDVRLVVCVIKWIRALLLVFCLPSETSEPPPLLSLTLSHDDRVRLGCRGKGRWGRL
jgi:hypothetical protein